MKDSPLWRVFNRETILNLDPRDFSEAEKQYLLRRFIGPTTRPSWKTALERDGRDAVRWNSFLGLTAPQKGGEPYRHTHERLIREAQSKPPRVPGNRVTDFTGWVYSLYLGRRNEESLAEGKEVERSIAKRLTRVPKHKEWELVYEDHLNEKPKALAISSLRTKSGNLWGAPDIVFRHLKSGEVLVVERKATNREIPSDGWPNLRAQLWAYARADAWRDASKVTLVGEIWGFSPLRPTPFLRQTVRWQGNDKEFNAQNQQLFSLYGGHVT